MTTKVFLKPNSSGMLGGGSAMWGSEVDDREPHPQPIINSKKSKASSLLPLPGYMLFAIQNISVVGLALKVMDLNVELMSLGER